MKPPALLRLLLAASLALPAVTAHIAFGATTQNTARVIVKFRADTAQARIASASDRVRVLAQAAGVSLQESRHVSADTQAVTASGMTSEELATRLSASSNVVYAVPDQRMHIAAVPNDPYYAQQWYLQAVQPAAINAESAWNTTTGTTSVVVADIDTGVRFDHEDLSSQLIPNGYDFVSDIADANDGDGWDGDASDPGDYDPTDALSAGSSWHGTHTSGLIAASANNARGIAGIAWQTRILPVRVLGIGGGWLSDIVAGMRWAAGLNVPGAPDNTTPAKVLNLSLGGDGVCATTYQDAINEIIAKGAVIVVAAGNHPVDGSPPGSVTQPGNCSGVLTVAGLRNTGTKVGYSRSGSEIGIAAPAGNIGDGGTSNHWLYPIGSTTNLGTTSLGANGYTMQSSNDTSAGTSFAAPLVSGVLALMLAENPSLNPVQAIARIKLGAKAFPQTASTICPSTPYELECNCTTSTCGAGMLNAPGAVAQAQRPISNISLPSTLTPGTVTALDGSTSAAMSGASVASYQWTVSGTVTSLTNADKSVASLIVPTAGTYTITLTVTDSNGKTDQSSVLAQFSTVTTASSSSGSSSGGGGGGDMSWLSLLGIAALVLLVRDVRRYAR